MLHRVGANEFALVRPLLCNPMCETVAKRLCRDYGTIVTTKERSVKHSILHGAFNFELAVLVELPHPDDFSIQEILRLVFLRSSSVSSKNAFLRCFRDR